MRRSSGMFGLQASIAVIMALAFGPAVPLRAETVRVHKIVKPTVAETTYITTQQYHVWSCWPATCSNPFADALFQGSTIPFQSTPPAGGILVGFQSAFDQGTHPCNCSWYIAWAYRGTVLFKIEDIPHHFKAATLVLKAENRSVSDPNFKIPFTGIFETSFAGPPWFTNGNLAYDLSDGAITGTITVERGAGPGGFAVVSSDPDLQKPVNGTFGFPAPPYPKGAVLEVPDPFSYRINVTSTVTTWVADWVHRDQTPLRGFILVGADESLPNNINRELLITYRVTLEFDIDEPVQ
jgi:hypothetical protein